jgi:ketosteroid isomerase-like protein
MNANEETIERYFTAWKNQSLSELPQIFSSDARYIVHPFKLEEYVGLEAITQYWKDNPVAKQIKPEPYIITKLVSGDISFLEWGCDYQNLAGEQKQMQGMMILEFANGLIKELREHFETQKI